MKWPILILLFFSTAIAGLYLFYRNHQPIPIPWSHPFHYDLDIKAIQSNPNQNDVTICCHGYGHNSNLIYFLNVYQVPMGHLVGFNFPDHDILVTNNHKITKFGTLDEILPFLFLLRYYACDQDFASLNLYGFSCGTAVITNALGILNKNLYEKELKHIGITKKERKQILDAVEKGAIILDCPLRSVEEILAHRGRSTPLEILCKHYAENRMIPIENLSNLKNLNLKIFVHFQNPDKKIGNRDDELYIERLKSVNRGTTTVTTGNTGSHGGYHAALWDAYRKYVANRPRQ
jgi:hypothetical protein